MGSVANVNTLLYHWRKANQTIIRTPVRRDCVSGILLLAVAQVSGCQKQSVPALPPDHSQVMVIPGLGISNRYEVEMTFSKIKNSFPDEVRRPQRFYRSRGLSHVVTVAPPD
jgi:hypothetical protein